MHTAKESAQIMSLRRYLDQTEVLFGKNRADSPLTIEYEGAINEEVLRESHQALCNRHPELCARIYPDEHGWILERPDKISIPNIVSIGGDLEELIRDYGAYSTSPGYKDDRDPDWKPLSRIIHSRGQQRGYVTLAINHTLIDGVNQFEYLRQFWELYTHICNYGSIMEEPSKRLPRPPSELIKERWTEIDSIDRPTNAKLNGSTRKTGIRWDNTEANRIMVRLNRNDTELIRATSRAHALSVSKFLIGISTLSVQGLQQVTTHDKFRISTLVGLRNYTSPPINPTETTYFSAPFSAIIPAGLGISAIGNEFSKQLEAAIHRKTITVLGYGNNSLDTQDADLSGNNLEKGLSFNNLGKIDTFKTPQDMRIVDYFPLRFKIKKVPWQETNAQLGLACFAYDDKLTLVFETKTERTQDILNNFAKHLTFLGVEIVNF